MNRNESDTNQCSDRSLCNFEIKIAKHWSVFPEWICKIHIFSSKGPNLAASIAASPAVDCNNWSSVSNLLKKVLKKRSGGVQGVDTYSRLSRCDVWQRKSDESSLHRVVFPARIQSKMQSLALIDNHRHILSQAKDRQSSPECPWLSSKTSNLGVEWKQWSWLSEHPLQETYGGEPLAMFVSGLDY